jgi:hypothetical protein
MGGRERGGDGLQRIRKVLGRLRANTTEKAMTERKACELLPNLVVAISAARVRRGDER